MSSAHIISSCLDSCKAAPTCVFPKVQRIVSVDAIVFLFFVDLVERFLQIASSPPHSLAYGARKRRCHSEDRVGLLLVVPWIEREVIIRNIHSRLLSSLNTLLRIEQSSSLIRSICFIRPVRPGGAVSLQRSP